MSFSNSDVCLNDAPLILKVSTEVSAPENSHAIAAKVDKTDHVEVMQNNELTVDAVSIIGFSAKILKLWQNILF